MQYLLLTTRAMRPWVDVVVDGCICLVNVLPLAFMVSTSGPMQRLMDGVNPTSGGTYVGWVEIVGYGGLACLEYVLQLSFLIQLADIGGRILHFGMFVWGCRLTSVRRKAQRLLSRTPARGTPRRRTPRRLSSASWMLDGKPNLGDHLRKSWSSKELVEVSEKAGWRSSQYVEVPEKAVRIHKYGNSWGMV